MIGLTPLTRRKVLLTVVCHYAIIFFAKYVALFTGSDTAGGWKSTECFRRLLQAQILYRN